MKRKNQKSIMVWLPVETQEDFKKYCESKGLDMSAVIRMHVTQLVADYRDQLTLSCVNYEQF